jgi:hypothetical protein
MKKKVFYSQLYRKTIYIDDPEYWIKVYAEFLFRIDDLEKQNCKCFKCQTDLENYRGFFAKLQKDRSIVYKNIP